MKNLHTAVIMALSISSQAALAIEVNSEVSVQSDTQISTELSTEPNGASQVFSVQTESDTSAQVSGDSNVEGADDEITTTDESAEAGDMSTSLGGSLLTSTNITMEAGTNAVAGTVDSGVSEALTITNDVTSEAVGSTLSQALNAEQSVSSALEGTVSSVAQAQVADSVDSQVLGQVSGQIENTISATVENTVSGSIEGILNQ